MPVEIQEITDRLAGDLNRSVFVEDSHFRPLAVSAQLGAIDEPRVRAVLSREPGEEYVRYFRRCGVMTARDVLSVPGNASLGLLPRLMVPVLVDDRALARLWLIDAEPTISADELTLVNGAAGEIREILLEQEDDVRDRVATGGQLLDEILQAGSSRRRALFERIQSSRGAASLDRLRACVLNTEPSGHAAKSDLAAGYQVPKGYLDSLLGAVEMRRHLGMIRDAQVVLLLSDDHARLPSQLDEASQRAAARHDVAVAAIGLGGVLDSPDGWHTSIQQAEFAARIAARVPEFNGLATWDSLGEYRLFFSYEWGIDGVAEIDSGVAELLRERRTPFAETVLAYLDRDGDVVATAASLNVHPTTLYYRLRQATRLLGRDLSGPARFRIHAALRYAELSIH